MLRSYHRVPKKLFGTLLVHGQYKKNGNISCRYQKYPLEEEPSYRVSCVVPKKVDSRAVFRNKVRRALYRAVKNIEIPYGMRILIFAQNKEALVSAEKDVTTLISSLPR